MQLPDFVFLLTKGGFEKYLSRNTKKLITHNS
jgi:hypothetical protein